MSNSLSTIGVGYYTIKTNNSNKILETSKSIELNDLSKTESLDDELITVKSNLDLMKMYDNIDDLSGDAELIVKRKVAETNSYVSGPGIITEFKLEVDDAYKGASKGDMITLISPGGIVTYDEYKSIAEENIKSFEKQLSNKDLSRMKVKNIMGENELITKGKEYVIFAKKETVIDKNSEEKTMYCILNIAQGQFEVNKDNITNKAFSYKGTAVDLENDIKSKVEKNK